MSQIDLEYFTDGERFPLDRLNLSKSAVNDRLLVNLLKAHEDRLVSVDLTDVKGLIGCHFNEMMDEEDVRLNKLQSLSVSSYELFGQSSLASKAVSSALPMLSEEDLQSSPSLDLDLTSTPMETDVK